jgi:hypothetical protein
VAAGRRRAGRERADRAVGERTEARVRGCRARGEGGRGLGGRRGRSRFSERWWTFSKNDRSAKTSTTSSRGLPGRHVPPGVRRGTQRGAGFKISDELFPAIYSASCNHCICKTINPVSIRSIFLPFSCDFTIVAPLYVGFFLLLC